MHHTITDFTLDIAQNSIEAGASVITVDILEQGDMLTLEQHRCTNEKKKFQS